MDRRQGDAAAVADQPGQADRADGGARPRHQGDPRRHHPEALRPRLRLLEPAEPSETGIAMYKAFHEYVPRMATPEMTAELESDMDKIAAGETSKDEVVRISREMLHSTTTELEDKREDFAKQIWQGMDEDKFLGPCKVCEEAGRKRENGEPNRLRIIDLKGGKRMYGCEGWIRDDPESPDSCPVSGPLPGRFYELWRLEEVCSVCGERPRLTVKKRGPGRPWKLCLNDDCPTMVEMREKRAEREAAKEARRGQAKAERRRAGPATTPRATRRPPAEGRRAARAEEARADHGSDQAGHARRRSRRPSAACSSPSRASTAPASPRRLRCSRGPRPRDDADPRARWHRRRGAGPRAAQGPRARARPAAPSCMLFSAARAQLLDRGDRARARRRARRRLRPLRRLDGRLPGSGARPRRRLRRAGQRARRRRPDARPDAAAAGRPRTCAARA